MCGFVPRVDQNSPRLPGPGSREPQMLPQLLGSGVWEQGLGKLFTVLTSYDSYTSYAVLSL
jgi:hypothetical protein